MNNSRSLIVLLLLSITTSLLIINIMETNAFTKNFGKSSSATTLNSNLSPNTNTSSTNTISSSTIGLSSPNTYTNPSFGIQISNPNNWKILESTDEDTGEIVTFVPPGEENSFEYLVTLGLYYYEADDNDDLSELLEEAIKIYKDDDETYDNFKVIGQSTITDKLSGYPSYTFTASYDYNGKPYKLTEYGFRIGETQYNIVYDAELDKFDKYLPQIKIMLESFKLI